MAEGGLRLSFQKHRETHPWRNDSRHFQPSLRSVQDKPSLLPGGASQADDSLISICWIDLNAARSIQDSWNL